MQTLWTGGSPTGQYRCGASATWSTQDLVMSCLKKALGSLMPTVSMTLGSVAKPVPLQQQQAFG